jgi:hypothetical protein
MATFSPQFPTDRKEASGGMLRMQATSMGATPFGDVAMAGTSPSTESEEEASAMKGTALLLSIVRGSGTRGGLSREMEFLGGSRIHQAARKAFWRMKECARERGEAEATLLGRLT